jgi:phosphoglycolate phosphatase
MKPKYKGVIFDLDGTLVDTLEDIAAAMNRALKKHGFPELPVEDYREKVGWGIRRLAFLSLPEAARTQETADMLAADSAGFYAEAPLVNSRPYPGILELINVLLARKIKTVVLTNKPDLVAQKVIAGLFPQAAFSIVRGESAERARKPDPACVWELLVELDLIPASVIFAGDSEIDMETALASGCYALGVGWGYRSRQVIMKAGAKRIIERPQELLELL